MSKLLFLAVLGGVAYGLRKLYEDTQQQAGFDRESEAQGHRAGNRHKLGDTAAAEALAAEDDRLDEALRESFPASDPPAVRPRR